MSPLLIVEEKYSSNGFNRPFKDRSNSYDLSIWLSTLKGKDKTVVQPHQQGVYNNEQVTYHLHNDLEVTNLL